MQTRSCDQALPGVLHVTININCYQYFCINKAGDTNMAGHTFIYNNYVNSLTNTVSFKKVSSWSLADLADSNWILVINIEQQ